MTWLSILALAFGLSMDAFAVAIAAGLVIPALTSRHVFRLAFHFGLFQFMMPVIGWMAGTRLAAYIGGFDHWLAFAVLTVLGSKMLWQAWHEAEDSQTSDPTRGWTLVTLSVATSIDALAVGLSMALLNVLVWVPSVVIGIVTAALTTIGIHSSSRLSGRFGRTAQLAGGVVLIGIGIQIVISHVLRA